MHRYITSDGSISNGLISQVKKGEKHFEVPSWSVYTHVMDGPNPKFKIITLLSLLTLIKNFIVQSLIFS